MPPDRDPTARPPANPQLAPFGTTIFAEMSALAAQSGAINLGQGFPDTDGPQQVLDAAKAAIDAGYNQYPPGPGFPELRSAIAAHQKRFYSLDVDPVDQILATVGATEAIAATILALCAPGDEVVTFEPYYDSYAASIALSGARMRTVPLRFPDFAVDEQALRAAFSARTRAVLLNTPHNPTGKVFTRGELELIARLAREHQAWVISDEVYEHLTFDGVEHVPMATLPGMAEHTITIGSGGKTFSTTGWKVGWAIGPAAAIAGIRGVKQFLTYVGSGPFQLAIATALALDTAVYADLASGLQAKRDLLVTGLRAAGMDVAVPAGTYFVVADVAPLGVRDAENFCRTDLPHRAGVVAVPVSAFCEDKVASASLVRFAFCKREKVLNEAVSRLGTLR